MRKTELDTEGSQVMLLDTVCNMFGGMVLIAILFVLVSQVSGTRGDKKAVTSPVSADVARQQRTVVDGLKKDIGEWEARVGTNVPPQTADTPLRSQLDRTKADIDDFTIRIAKARNILGEQDAELAVLQKEINALREKAAAEILATRDLMSPRAQSAGNKRGVCVAFKGKRLYAIQDVTQNNPASRKLDESEADVVTDAATHLTAITLHENGGQPVVNGCEHTGILAQALKNVDPETEIFIIAVYPDSFSEFNYVKSLMISKGFRYFWMPARAGQPIIAGQGESKVL